jgi:hypothetical protein
LQSETNGPRCGSGVIGSRTRLRIWRREAWGFESLLPHKQPIQRKNPVVTKKGHNGDTLLLQAIRRMQSPSEPQIDKGNPDKWFIFWQHDVPLKLWPYHKRKRERIKVYDNINRFKGEERERYAEERRLIWKYKLEHLGYNPFEEELKALEELQARERKLEEQLRSQSELSEEDARKLTPIKGALDLFIASRIDRKIDSKSITSYRNTCTWLLDYFLENPEINVIFKVKHIHITEAVNKAARSRGWSATTINKEIEFAMTIFNWLANQDYIYKNPSSGKIQKLRTKKTMHRFYDPETARLVKAEVLVAGLFPLYRAMQFTYWMLIRSKDELRKIKVGDIDFTLKRFRFRPEVSKNDSEQYRDYPPEFEKVILEMKLDRFPKDFYIFGKDGVPGPVQMGANFISRMWAPVRDRLGISDDYTVYGWKHTRILHLLMLGVEGYEISYMARHESLKTKEDYLRDYGLTLKHIWAAEDLTF